MWVASLFEMRLWLCGFVNRRGNIGLKSAVCDIGQA